MKSQKQIIRRNNRQNTVGSYLGIALLVIIADQVTKYFVDSNNIVKNEGILFGFSFPNSNLIMIGMSIGAILILSFFVLFVHLQGKKFYSVIIGGIMGNLIDRIMHGYVIDWIRIGSFPVFNLADASISVSVILLMGYSAWHGSVYRRNRDRFMKKLRY